MNIPEELLPVVEWWEKDGKKTLAVVAVAGVVALGIWSWRAHRESVREDAAAALIGYGDADSLQAAVDKYGALESGPMLKLKLAAAYFARQEEGDAQKALELYDELCASGSAPAGYEDVPVVGRAECLEALERWDEAAKEYAGFAEKASTNSCLRLTAQLGAARCRAQIGERDAAVAALEALKKELVADEAAVARVDMTLDVVKRWVKRETPVAVASPVVAEAADVVPGTAEAPARPAEPEVKDASSIVLPSALPAAPVAVPAPVVTPAPAAAPEAAPAPAPEAAAAEAPAAPAPEAK